MKSFNNARKGRFLQSLPQSSLETCDIATRCSFNFSYFEANQAPGQDFSDWNENIGACSLTSLLEKIKSYTKEPLAYWRNERVGSKGLRVLAYYDAFPKRSDFSHPPHVPHDAIWARFRLGNLVRLIGFVIPESLAGTEYVDGKGNKYLYHSNTFFVVFLDEAHRFFQTEQA
ncbi:MAG: hypothetical protein MJK04_20935 [Psychrosphaera sp.]|nr:hypothetical protein [Psychrosphaera sp.]